MYRHLAEMYEEKYGMAQGVPSPSGASALLREQGVPGIRYFDGMSRGRGQGTRNYVVFDDQLPKIVGVQR